MGRGSGGVWGFSPSSGGAGCRAHPLCPISPSPQPASQAWGRGTAWMRFLFFFFPGVWAAPFPFTRQVSPVFQAPSPPILELLPGCLLPTSTHTHPARPEPLESPGVGCGCGMARGAKSKPRGSRFFLTKGCSFSILPRSRLLVFKERGAAGGDLGGEGETLSSACVSIDCSQSVISHSSPHLPPPHTKKCSWQ